MNRLLRLRIALQTMKDLQRTTLILIGLFMGIAVMYAGMYPAFKDALMEMLESELFESFAMFRGAEEMGTYVGFLNLELYQIFWLLILGILIGFVAASLISKEIEGKTIDILMSNPVSRKQIVFEKFLGMIPCFLIVNFGTMLAVIGITVAINEELNLWYLLLTHLVSIPYFIAIIAIGLLLSVIIDEKMKASIIIIAILVGMFVFETLSLMIPDYKTIGYLSLTHYFDPHDTLLSGRVDAPGVLILICVITICLVISLIYFEHRDIEVT